MNVLLLLHNKKMFPWILASSARDLAEGLFQRARFPQEIQEIQTCFWLFPRDVFPNVHGMYTGFGLWTCVNFLIFLLTQLTFLCLKEAIVTSVELGEDWERTEVLHKKFEEFQVDLAVRKGRVDEVNQYANECAEVSHSKSHSVKRVQMF